MVFLILTDAILLLQSNLVQRNEKVSQNTIFLPKRRSLRVKQFTWQSALLRILSFSFIIIIIGFKKFVIF